MKTLHGAIALALSLGLLLLPGAATAETVKATIKSVDEKAGTVTFSRDGKADEEVLPVDASVKLAKVKKGSKARLEIEDGRVKEIDPERKPSAAGY